MYERHTRRCLGPKHLTVHWTAIVSPQALPASWGNGSPCLNVQRLLRGHLFKWAVLVFRLTNFFTPLISSPAYLLLLTKGGARIAMLSAEIVSPHACLNVLELGDDLSS